MNAIGAFPNYPANLLKPDFPAVIGFTRAARRKPRANDREDDRLKISLIVVGKGTVYENVPSAHSDARAARTLEIAASSCGTEKCVARPFGLRMRTPSEVVPNTFEVLRLATLEVLRLTTFEVLALATFEVLRVTTFGAFVAQRETFEARDLDGLVIDKLCARFQAKPRI
jgi:hypothetical protein